MCHEVQLPPTPGDYSSDDDLYAEKATALETDEDAASVTGGVRPVE